MTNIINNCLESIELITKVRNSGDHSCVKGDAQKAIDELINLMQAHKRSNESVK